MSGWIEFDPTLLSTDAPLDAASLHCLRGNLSSALDESGYRYQAIPHGSSAYAEHAMSTSGVWEDCTPEWGGWPVPIREVEGGGYRQVRVVVEAHTYSACHATLRLCAIPQARGELTIDDDEGIVGLSSFGDITITSTSTPTAFSTTITIDDVYLAAGLAVDLDEPIPTVRYPEVAIHAIARFSDADASEYLQLRAPYVEEVT